MLTGESVPVYATAVLTASALGGVIALANMVIGKEQKTSEARKDWIDGLRDSLAGFFANAQLLSVLWESGLQASPRAHEVHPKKSPDEVLKFRTDHKELYGQMLAAYYDAHLRLGTNTEEFKDLIAELEEIYRAFEGNTADCHLQFKRKEPSLRANSSRAMKDEWVKVKEGEPLFRRVKQFLYGLLAVLAASLVVYWIHRWL